MGTDTKSFKELLKKAKKTYTDSKETVSGMVDKLDEGEYLMKLSKCELTVASTGALMVKRHHIVVEGDVKGAQAFDNIVLSTDFGFAQLRKWFEILGIECPDDPQDIADIIPQISEQGYTAKIRVSHQKDSDFIKLKIVELVEGEATEKEEEKETENEAEEETIDISAMDRSALKKFIEEKELDIVVKKSMSDDNIRELIAEAFSTEGGEEENPLLVKTREFCTAHDIEYDDDTDIDGLKKLIKKEKYEKVKLDEEEIALLKELGLEGNIEEVKKTSKIKIGKK